MSRSDYPQKLWRVLAVWGAATAGVYIGDHGFPALRGLWTLIAIGIGLPMFLFIPLALLLKKKTLQALLAAVLILILGTGPLVGYRQTIIVGGTLHFYLHRPKYSLLVAFIEKLPDKQSMEKICRPDSWFSPCTVNTEPLRIEFHYLHGFLNWHDIVYDPSGATINPNPPYSGYLRASERIASNWSLCHESD